MSQDTAPDGQPDATTVEVVDTGDRYEARTPDGRLAGFAEYVRRPGAVVVTHTEVDPADEGQGIGSALAAGLLDQVRAAGDHVVPLCPFVKAYVARHPEYQDLVQH
ncbi:GNAT family N-acetyltransferase [Cellulosimicrobium marinum]|uniref:GNAT family N-acetyltransferase n=1 Tax=Cellulosimicrobium marinum TaxID=1638992 RepID=UPI001E5141BE|nr:GNAT family N-acetyltransferase [Cellulosimicrobium marinum]MCB7135019.1 N-acetyltransferase [Cellulosimicrobium marinum]